MALRVTIAGRDREAMTDLVRRYEVDVVRTTVTGSEREGFRVDAVVPDERVAELTEAGYAIDVIEDDKSAAKRRHEIDWHPDDLPGRPRPRDNG